MNDGPSQCNPSSRRETVSRVCYVFYIRNPYTGTVLPCAEETQKKADDHAWRCTNVVRVEVPL